jgi:hypothetical protein
MSSRARCTAFPLVWHRDYAHFPRLDGPLIVLSVFPGILSMWQNFAPRFQNAFARLTQRLDPKGYGRLQDAETWYGFGLWFALLATAQIVIRTVTRQAALALDLQLLPAFSGPSAPNFMLIMYMFMVAAGAGTLILLWLRPFWPRFTSVRFIITPAFVGSIAFLAALVYPQRLVQGFFALAALSFFLSHLFSEKMVPPAQAGDGKQRLFSVIRTGLLIIAVGWSLWTGYKAYFPLYVAHDYYEVEDTVKTAAFFEGDLSTAPATMPRSLAMRCLESMYQQNMYLAPASKTVDKEFEKEARLFSDVEPVVSAAAKNVCPLGKGVWPSEKALQILERTGRWQGTAGRLLFHHAYVLIPALQMLEGKLPNVPTIYGYGNTAAFAAAMHFFGGDLKGYFTSEHVLAFLGLLWIAFAAGLIARSYIWGLIAFAVSLGFYYALDFSITYLAVGFNPLRMFGLVLQTLSIFYALREKARFRTAAIVAAYILSAAWNFEFATLGAAGQLIALLSPLHRAGWRGIVLRAGAFFAAVLLMAYVKATLYAPLLVTNDVSFFKIAVPHMAPPYYLALLAASAALAIGFAWLAIRNYSLRERHARFALLVVILLLHIKFLFNPAWPHLLSILIFSAPMLLLSLTRWRLPYSQDTVLKYITTLSLLFIVGLTVYFRAEGREYRNQFVTPFETTTGAQLGEDIIMPMPSKPVAQRVAMIKRWMQPGERVLILSPFDHLLSYLTRPASYCGSFDIMLNLVTKDNIRNVERCALEKKPLVIFDPALRMKCPSYAPRHDEIYMTCRGRYVLKHQVTAIFDDLRPHLQLLEATPELEIYRVKDGVPFPPSKP